MPDSYDPLDEALTRFAATGPEFGGGLSNHGPMAAEALVALGRTDAVEPWAEQYARRLLEHPDARNAIEPEHWKEALGDIGRAGDWIAFFSRELDERPWRDALDVWVERLAPGIMAGATHGILRTVHAVRALERGENSLRIHELSEGLGYWAARYQTLPAASATPRRLTVPEALARVDRVPDAERSRALIFDAVKAVDPARFGPAIEYVDVDRDADAFVSDITRTFVRQYLANARGASISFIHTVTAPSAVRILAPYLSPPTQRSVMRYAWQACASIYAAYASGAAGQPPDGVEPPDRDDLIEQAVAAQDEHAIKFTEACLREHRITGDVAFLAAAQDAVQRLRR